MAHVHGYKADAALIPEPMQEQLVRANVGVLWFQIEVRGRPVHVRAMSTGSNAIDSCWKVVGALREFCLLYTSPSPRDGLLSRMPSSA